VHVPSSSRDDDVCSLDLPCIVDDNDNDNDNDAARTKRRATRLDLRVLFDSSELIALRKRGSMAYVDKAETSYKDFCDYVTDGGSAVIPVAEDNVLVPFLEDLGTDFRKHLSADKKTTVLDSNADSTTTTTITTTTSIADTLKVGINVYHSGPGAVALNRHFDQYDVLVVHLDGRKQWEIGVFEEEEQQQQQNIDLKDTKRIETVSHWTNVTLVPGDLLYIPKGVYHAATTADGYESTTHATIGLEY